jgi:lipid-binding SYLF domain-containing protein
LLRFANIAVILSLAVGSGESASPVPPKSAAGVSVSSAAHVLDQLSKSPQRDVPEAVLNSTKCIIVIPSIKTGTLKTEGIASCREGDERWSAPETVKFRGSGTGSQRSDLLIFVLTDSGVRTLQTAELQVGGKKSRDAPLVSTTPITTQVELTMETLAYKNIAGIVSGSEARGVIQSNTRSSHTISNAISGETSEKFLASVVSYFNTMSATGIVIHHTAVIPGETKVPGSASDIEEYHRARGFEILCFGRVYHVAYHYLIMPNGRVKQGRPERCEGAHAKGYNSYLGISVVGDFSSEDNPVGRKGPTRPSAKQIASLIQLCRRLKDRYNIPLQHIVRHSDISSTRCPGDRFPFRFVLEQLQRPTVGLKPRPR